MAKTLLVVATAALVFAAAYGKCVGGFCNVSTDLLSLATAFNYQVEVQTGTGPWGLHAGRLHVLVSDGANVHNVSMNYPTLQPAWSYKSVANIPYAAPNVKAANIHYTTASPYNKVSIGQVIVTPIYLSEPYRSKLTKRFCLYNRMLSRNQIAQLSPC